MSDVNTVPRPRGGWSGEILDVAQAIVVPPEKNGFVTSSGVLMADGSPCQHGALWRKHRPLTLPPEPPQSPPEELTGTWLWGGVLWLHFGHFVVESTGRLWGLAEHPDVDGILFAPKRPGKASPVRGLHKEMFEAFGWHGAFKVADRPLQVERLIVPGQGFGLGPLIIGTPKFRAFAREFGKDIAPEGSEKLYISRSKLGLKKGLLIGERQMEEKLAAEGYEVFHPEDHSIPVQVARYKAARQIIAAEGSAIHLFAYAARPEQRVAVVLRRRSDATRMISKHLRAFGGVEPLLLDHLKRSWAREGTRTKRLFLGELDLPSIQHGLAEGGFITKGTPVWPDLTLEEIRAQIGPDFQVVADFEEAGAETAAAG